MLLALSTNGAAATRETFQKYREAQIPAMEVSNGQMADADRIDFPMLRRCADEFGITLWSYHLPFAPFKSLDPSVPALAEGTVAYFCSLIDKAADAGIRIFVVHPSGEPIAEEDRPMRMSTAKKSLFALAEYAKKKGGVIAVEDLPRTCLGRDSSDILELISAHPDLRVCFDTNHLLKEDIGDFIRAVGDKSVTTHVSDYDFINERHWLPGEGQIDWAMLKNTLKSVGYAGCWLYELGLGGSDWTIDRPRALTHRDIRRNYEEIMAGLLPTPVGIGKKDLPMTKPKA
jgi:sugar phosphate isomerase/epimerase